MLSAFWISACSSAAPGWTGGSDGSSPQVTARALGSTFVGIGGSGFPTMAQAVVTGTTSQGSATVNAMTDNGGRLNTSVAVPDGFQGSMSVKVTVGSAAASATAEAAGKSDQEPADDAGVRPLPAVGCTVTADVGSIPDVGPGDVVCLNGDSSSRLTISAGGAPGSPITYSGGGNSTVRGIDVVTSNVIVEGFTSKDGENMGARLQGNDITFRDNTIAHPVYRGDDTDGMRFFGDGINIVHNTIKDVSDGSDCNEDGCGAGPHPDCMQTFYSDSYPTSSDVTIEGNRCEDIAAQCLIGEGPVIPGENVNGPGQSIGLDLLRQLLRRGRRPVRPAQGRQERHHRRERLQGVEQQGHRVVRRVNRCTRGWQQGQLEASAN